MANFPTSVSTDANLYIAVNGLQTTLAVAVGTGDTTLTLTSTSGFPSTGMVTIDNNEVVSYTGISGADLTGCTRGADGTTAFSHGIGVTVGLTVVAAHHNRLKDEVIAVETALGASFAKGNLSSTVGTDGITVTGGTGAVIGAGTSISQQAATDSLPGFLTAADHLSFNTTKLPLAGGTMTGDITLDNAKAVVFKETTANGTDSVTVKAPDSVTSSYTLQLPPAVASAGQVLTDVAGNGVTSWATSASGITQLTSDVTAGPGSGSQAATVVSVGGQSASNVAASVTTANNALPKAGGTMSGAIAMGTNKITGLGNGTAAQDAAAFGQIFAGFQAPVQATVTTSTSTTSSSFVDTVTTATITPTSASHRIKITVNAGVTTVGGNTVCYMTIARGGINLAGTNGFTRTLNPDTNAAAYPVSMSFIDSPATTSATTYTVRYRNNNGASTCLWNTDSMTSVIILEEIV